MGEWFCWQLHMAMIARPDWPEIDFAPRDALPVDERPRMRYAHGAHFKTSGVYARGHTIVGWAAGDSPALTAYDAESGEQVWRHSVGPNTELLGVYDGAVWLWDRKTLACETCAVSDGARRAAASPPGQCSSPQELLRGPLLVTHGPRAGCFVVYGDSCRVTMWSASGAMVWEDSEPPPDYDFEYELGLTDCGQYVYFKSNPYAFYDRDGRRTLQPLVGLQGISGLCNFESWRTACAFTAGRVLIYAEERDEEGHRIAARFELHVLRGGVPTVIVAPLEPPGRDMERIDHSGSGNGNCVHPMFLSAYQVLLVSGTTAQVLRSYTICALPVWRSPTADCALGEHEAAIAARAAIDALPCGDDGSVGLVRAVLDGFVAEDARLTALRHKRAF